MAKPKLFHALGLHMHQPPDNLRLLIESDPREAERIIRCYERVPRYIRRFRDCAHIHVGFSGILLEQLRDPDIVDSYRGIIDIPAMLEAYADAQSIELVGMGYYHPIFPLIPREDWEDHLIRGREIIKETFGRAPRGFWPSKLAFCIDMIPAVAKAGYQYVIVDDMRLRRHGEMADICRPYRLTVDDASIVVIPRDSELSEAQAQGTDPQSFSRAVQSRLQNVTPAHPPRLITTWSDGENGGWFRQMHEQSGFFGHFFAPLMEAVQAGGSPVVPVSLSDFIAENSPVADPDVCLAGGTPHAGVAVGDRALASAEEAAVAQVRALSARYRDLRSSAGDLPPEVRAALDEARRLILEAETSCFLSWDDEWREKLYDRTRLAEALLDQATAKRGARQ